MMNNIIIGCLVAIMSILVVGPVWEHPIKVIVFGALFLLTVNLIFKEQG